MSAQEIVLDGGLGSKLQFKQRDDMVVVDAVDGWFKIVAVLDRTQQRLLLLYLQERLGE